MGLTRKLMSVSTLGLVSYRDKGGRAQKYMRQTRNAARIQIAQNAAQIEVERQQLDALDYANVRAEVRQYELDMAQYRLDLAAWEAVHLPPPEGPPVQR
jgi:hypothetical protein